MIRVRYLVAGLVLAVTLRWAWLAWRSRGVYTATWGEDPETGLRLRLALDPGEAVEARAREAATELVG